MTDQTINTLLLASLCQPIDERHGAQLEQLPVSVWQELVRRATWNSVAPLLWCRLKAHDLSDTVPSELRPTLRQTYRESAIRNTLLSAQLSKLLAVLRQEGIPTIVLKGGHLAAIVYPDGAQRPMSDIDLLVPKGELARAEAAVAQLDYDVACDAQWQQFYEQQHFHIPYRSRNGSYLEIHWNLCPGTVSLADQIESFWARATTARIADQEAMVLSPEDVLLHICWHGCFQHDFGLGLRPFCDVAEVCRHGEHQIDWHTLCSRAQAYRLCDAVHCTFQFVARWLGGLVPDWVLKKLKTHVSNPEFAGLVEQYLLDLEPPGAIQIPFGLERSLAVRGRVGGSGALLRSVFPPLRELRWIYGLPPNSARACLYYVWRPLDLARRRMPFLVQWGLRRKHAKRLLRQAENRHIVERACQEIWRRL